MLEVANCWRICARTARFHQSRSSFCVLDVIDHRSSSNPAAINSSYHRAWFNCNSQKHVGFGKIVTAQVGNPGPKFPLWAKPVEKWLRTFSKEMMRAWVTSSCIMSQHVAIFGTFMQLWEWRSPGGMRFLHVSSQPPYFGSGSSLRKRAEAVTWKAGRFSCAWPSQRQTWGRNEKNRRAIGKIGVELVPYYMVVSLKGIPTAMGFHIKKV
jgi:hypothetical protein